MEDTPLGNIDLNNFEPPRKRRPPRGSHPVAVRVFVTLLVLAVFGAALYGVYVWQHAALADETAYAQSLNGQLAAAKAGSSQAKSAAPNALTVTDQLEDGTEISYPLTAGNANVIWWSQTYYDMSSAAPSGSIVISDKLVPQFLSTIPSDTLTPICGNKNGNFNDIDIQMGVFDPVQDQWTHNQYANCLDMVVASQSKYAASAKQVQTKALNDISGFEGSVRVVK